MKDIDSLNYRIDDLLELYNLGQAEQDMALQADTAHGMEELSEHIKQLFFSRALSCEYDSSGCYVHIQAGSGGQDAFDWTST